MSPHSKPAGGSSHRHFTERNEAQGACVHRPGSELPSLSLPAPSWLSYQASLNSDPSGFSPAPGGPVPSCERNSPPERGPHPGQVPLRAAQTQTLFSTLPRGFSVLATVLPAAKPALPRPLIANPHPPSESLGGSPVLSGPGPGSSVRAATSLPFAARPCRPPGQSWLYSVSDVSSPFAWESFLTLERDQRCPFSPLCPNPQARVCQLWEEAQRGPAGTGRTLSECGLGEGAAEK